MSAVRNPIGLGVTVLGGIVMVIATFLPLWEPTGRFRTVVDNTMVQHGGWWLILFALAIVVNGFLVSIGKGGRWRAVIGCAVSAGYLFIAATDKSSRTLYPVNLDGSVDSSGPGIVADLGIAIYVGWVGVAVAFAGSLMVAGVVKVPTATSPPDDSRPTKKCPDCAETILADAHVCKHCGYRYPIPTKAPPTSGAPQTKAARKAAPGPRTVVCPECAAKQTIRATAPKFKCGRCDAISPVPN